MSTVPTYGGDESAQGPFPDKISAEGLGSLTDDERRRLDEVSRRYHTVPAGKRGISFHLHPDRGTPRGR
jgi:hypothetical protein